MRAVIVAGGLLGIAAGCGGERREDCAPSERLDAFVDADGDGFGAGAGVRTCVVRRGWSAEDGDCADDDPETHPEAAERCNGLDDDCDDGIDDGLAEEVFFLDEDGDGFGEDRTATTACAPPPGWVDDHTDCDDQDQYVSPGVVEVCNDGVDDDCDGIADDDDDSLDVRTRGSFYLDRDADGFGAPGILRLQCAEPPGTVTNALDCDDNRAGTNPAAPEICNFVDDDCDDLVDHLDDSIDPALLQPGFVDADADAHGDPQRPIDTCGFRPGIAARAGDDCDDADPDVHPGRPETTCNAVDDDCAAPTPDNPDADGDGVATCDGDCDDTDPDTRPGANETPADGVDSDCDNQEDCYGDADGDGLRNDIAAPAGPDAFCDRPPNHPPGDLLDCDDADPAVDWAGDWVADLDGDGFGAGPVVVSGSCAPPGPGHAPENHEPDCDDANPDVRPGAPDPCNDGTDADCDSSDACRTCAEWLASDPTLPSGTYDLRPDGAATHAVFCDMDQDGGGWTLVGAAEGVVLGLDNYGVTSSRGLDDPRRGTFTGGIWDGLLPVAGPTMDVRFVCTLAANDPAAIDLSFYDVPWYGDLTGPFARACFQAPGLGVTPARRDNLTGQSLPETDLYDSGALVGEGYCGDLGAFTIDFDDAGKDSDESDGTDWGNDDYLPKCGAVRAGYAWYVFARE